MKNRNGYQLKQRVRLRLEMKRKGWSQSALAKRAKVPVSTLGMVVSGGRVPGVRIAVQLARALGVTVESIWG